MVVLGGESEDAQGAVDVTLRIVRVCIAQEPGDGEVTALDPDFGRLVNGVEDH